MTAKQSTASRVVVIGGGNGTSRLLKALLPLLQSQEIASLHALVHMADDGGSTGRLRQQYDVGSLGDLTKCLMALSPLWNDVRGKELLRALDYRFANGDMSGHTLRNILLAVFELTSADIDSALAIFARLVQIPKYSGVIPTTLKALTQQVEVKVDDVVKVLGEGEHFIAHKVNLQINSTWKPGDVKVAFKEKNTELNPRAAEVVAEATHIIIAPGHTYGTILPALASPGLGSAITNSKAHIAVVMTLLTTPQQTEGWSGEDFVRVYESYIGRPVDTVISNTGEVDINLVAGQTWVEFKEDSHPYQLVAEDIVSTEEQKVQGGDTVPRAIVVHDEEKIRNALQNILNN